MDGTVITIALAIPDESVSACAVYQRTIAGIFPHDLYTVTIVWSRKDKPDALLVDDEPLLLWGPDKGEEEAAAIEALKFVASGYLENKGRDGLTDEQRTWVDLGRSEYLAIEVFQGEED